jgi:arginyl-tRNA synthetase
MDAVSAIREKLANALAAFDISVQAEDIHLEHTEDFAHGDYASNVALVFAKQLKMPPRELAEKLAAEARGAGGVASVEVAGPGFINFTLSPEVFADVVKAANSGWGSNELLKKETILVEYTSPNLFKPLHIGNLIGNIIGESVTRLFEFSGADVKRINYPSDIGLPVAKCVWGLMKTGGAVRDIAALGEAYRVGNAAYEADAKAEIDAINKALYEDSDPKLTALREAGINTSRRHLDALCERLGTTFDYVFFESETGPVGKRIVEERMDVFEKSDGAIVFHGEKVGLHTRVFVNSAGLPTYEAKDIGNFEFKRTQYPEWDRSYIVVGNEQKEYLKVVFAAIKEVFPEAKEKVLAHIANGFLTLTTGKMSSREGNVITGESLIADLIAVAKQHAADSRAEDKEKLAEEVAVAALKFQILKGGTSKDIVFDKEKALSVEGDSGPYLQYTHARTHAIMEKAAEAKVKAKYDASAAPSDLVRLIYRFPEIVLRAQEELEPHILANYLIAVASTFNSWYAKEQILDGTDAAAHKVALTDVARLTLKNGLWLLGIPTPEKV